jgi:hypothetical protein
MIVQRPHRHRPALRFCLRWDARLREIMQGMAGAAAERRHQLAAEQQGAAAQLQQQVQQEVGCAWGQGPPAAATAGWFDEVAAEWDRLAVAAEDGGNEISSGWTVTEAAADSSCCGWGVGGGWGDEPTGGANPVAAPAFVSAPAPPAPAQMPWAEQHQQQYKHQRQLHYEWQLEQQLHCQQQQWAQKGHCGW